MSVCTGALFFSYISKNNHKCSQVELVSCSTEKKNCCILFGCFQKQDGAMKLLNKHFLK